MSDNARRVGLVALGLVVALHTPVRARASNGVMPVERRVAEAIAQAVRDRVGADADVTVTSVVGVRVPADVSSVIARPEPGARVVGPLRFVLSAPSAAGLGRIGEATATLHVRVHAVAIQRTVVRGERLEAGDVTPVWLDLDGRRLMAVPTLVDAVGARATRDLAAGTVLAPADVAVDPAVRAGDVVRTRVRVGDVVIVADRRAIESGEVAQVVRVMNEETRRVVRARIVAKGEVEVVDVR